MSIIRQCVRYGSWGLISVAAASSTSREASAFFPKLIGHTSITNDALSDSELTRIVSNEPLQFSDRAKRQIVYADVLVDDTRVGEYKSRAPHFTDESFTDASFRLVEFRDRIVDLITQPIPDGNEARAYLGRALHTTQDFYAHSNWVELGVAGFYDALGETVLSNPGPYAPMCPGAFFALGGDGNGSLTTAYYDFDHELCIPDPLNPVLCCQLVEAAVPEVKCGHRTPMCPLGMDKDLPATHYYDAAWDSARLGTVDYVSQILDDPRVANNAKAIRALMDVPTTLAFVVDTSAELMGWTSLDLGVTALEVAKQAIVAAVDEMNGTADEPDKYIVATFDDSSPGLLLKTDDIDEFKTAVSSIGVTTAPCVDYDSGCACRGALDATLTAVLKRIQADGDVHILSTLHPSSRDGFSAAIDSTTAVHTGDARRIKLYPTLLYADSDYC